ncbi:MAG: diaminopimelate epimerase [Acidimicrobiales bacterium]
MTLRALQKWHGAGNDFLVDVQDNGRSPWWTPARARAICHRTTGVGADGLLVATLGPTVTMVLYNADGSVAEMSGNGIRCLAAAVRRATNATWDTLDVETVAGVRSVQLTMNGDAGNGIVAMGNVLFDEPLEGALGVAKVGNPHVVVLDDVSWSDGAREDLAAKLAAQVGGANVEFLTVLGADHLRIRVIERGVGWTQACGTGSCAVAAVARGAGLSGDVVTIDNPGGALRVTLRGNEATLSGPVQFVANVEWLEA